MLDVDLGTYPYVTSSTTTAGRRRGGQRHRACSLHEVLGIGRRRTRGLGSLSDGAF